LLSRAIAFWQVAPRCAGSQHPEYPVQYATVIDTRHASGLVGQKWLDHAPLEISQVISAHAERESVFHARVKPKVATSPSRWHLERMDPTAFIARIRDHYVDQFRAFTEQQRAHFTQGGPEVKFQLNGQSELFEKLY
jgi:hypothetical protein